MKRLAYFSILLFTIIIFVACESQESYVVRFFDDQQTLLLESEIQQGSSATAPEEPSKEGHTFVGWSASYENVTTDLAIHPIFELNEYTVRFFDENSEEIYQTTVSHGSNASLPDAPTKVGHTFVGWSASYEKITEDVDLYAQFEINRYLVSFTDGDIIVETIEVDHGQTVERPQPIEKEGYAFIDWAYDGQVITQDLRIEAIWEPLIVKVEFRSNHILLNEHYVLPTHLEAINYEGTLVRVEVEWETSEFYGSQEGAFTVLGRIDFFEELFEYHIHVTSVQAGSKLLSGYVMGDANAEILVSATDGINVWFTITDDSGYFEFNQLPLGHYDVRVSQRGYRLDEVQTWWFESSSDALTLSTSQDKDDLAVIVHHQFVVEEIPNDAFFYEWIFTGDLSGYETSVKPFAPREINLIDETFIADDSQAALKLEQTFNQHLVQGDVAWQTEYASRLWDIFNRIPIYDHALSHGPTLWYLTHDYLADDIEITYGEDYHVVLLSTHVFENATPRLVELDGVRGLMYSNRLYHAVVTFITSEGNDIEAVDHILQERFGVTVLNVDYPALTVLNEPAEAYQMFKPYELLQLLEMFEEMPQGFHKIDGLHTIVRRIDGMPHPLYGEAPAVAWVHDGYIEFMESAFTTVSLDYLHRLIIHEKAHFMWEHLFSDELKEAWIELGGWYETDETKSGWATTKTTEFVSAYAHSENPDEDMAESLSYYLVNSDQLLARAPGKYEFIQQRIMHGTRYLSVIREDLTFEVYNLWPDYDYPGKIIRVTTLVEGEPEEDKLLTVEIELNRGEGLSDGADYAFTRIYSAEEPDKFFDLYLNPVDGDAHTLRGSITLSKYFKAGFYTTDQIVVTDTVGNQRFEGQGSLGFKAFVNNPLEDLTPPIFVEESFRVDIIETEEDGHQIFIVDISFEIVEDNILDWNTAHLHVSAIDSEAYSFETWGWYDWDENRVYLRYWFHQFHPRGYYEPRTLSIYDLGGNQTVIDLHLLEGFNDQHRFHLDTLTPDSTPPEVDINNIHITAVPTNPQAPNGETLVTITYYARDDLSGLGPVYYALRNPLGQVFGQWHYHENFYTFFFQGDAQAWTKYTINVVLPEGSAPGTWGLLEITVYDKTNNFYTYNFAEIIRFDVLEE